MLYNTDLEKMVRSTTPSDEKLKSKGVESVRQHVTTLNRYLTISIEEFKEFVRENLCDSEIRLDEDAVRQIEKIESEYLTEEFIYGRNPAYTLVRRARIEGVGEFELRLEIKKGLIRKVNMLGDFFLVGDLDGGLLARLQGVPFEKKAVEEALLDVEPSAIIMNMTKEQLIELINKIF